MKKLMAILALIPFLGFGGQLDYTTAEINATLGATYSLIGDITQSSVAYDDGAGTSGVALYDSMDEDRPYYNDGGIDIYFDGSEWMLDMGLAQYTNPSQSYLPPRTGWMRLGSVDPDVTVDFIGAGGGGLDDSTIPNLTLVETLATNDLLLVNIDGTNQSATVETLVAATTQSAYAGTGRFILSANNDATNMLETLPVFNIPRNEIVNTLRDSSGIAIPITVEASSWQIATGLFTDGEIPNYPFEAYTKYTKLGSATTGGTTDVYRVSGLPDRPVVVKWWSHDNNQTTNMTVEIIGVTTNTVTGYDIGAGTATPEVSTNLPLNGVLIVRLSATDDNYGINMIEFSYDVEAPFIRYSDIEDLKSEQAAQLVENTRVLTNHFQTLEFSEQWSAENKGWGGMETVYVHPDRRDLGFEFYGLQSSMPYEDYTNGLVFWLDASVPIANEGETNAIWADASTNRNDATQTGIYYHPERIFTNGTWALEFDGVDDLIEVEGNLFDFGTNAFSIDVTFDTSAPATSGFILSKYVSAGNHRSWGLSIRADGALWFFTSNNGASSRADKLPATSVPSGVNTVTILKEGSSVIWKINGVAASSDGGGAYESLYINGMPLVIGAAAQSASLYTGVLKEIKINEK